MDDRGFFLDDDSSAVDVYSKLDEDEVRTLLLAPGKGKSPIICEMQVISNPKITQYEALSYVWGTTSNMKTIQCNGFEFQVTESLHTALLHLRYNDSWRRIWVDQLCINQEKLPELRSQVSLMGKIYSTAVRVIVWLGDYDEKMSKAWNLLQDTNLSSSLVRSDYLHSSPTSSPQSKPSTPRRTSSGSSTTIGKSTGTAFRSYFRASTSKDANNGSGRSICSGRSSWSSLRSSNRASSSKGSRESLLNGNSPSRSRDRLPTNSPSLKYCLAIFQHVWFSRKWTFQEIILSQAAIICCGEMEMAWSDLTTWYFHYASKLRAANLLYDSHGSFEVIMNVRNELEKETLKLSNLLMLTRQRRSIKSEDAIYSLLGLIPDLSEYLIDYQNVTLMDLYLAAFKYCLEKEDDLSILSAAGVYSSNPHSLFPSWLPNWQHEMPLRPLVLSNNQAATSKLQVTGSRKPIYSFDERETMIIRGFRIGCICTRSGVWPPTYYVPDHAAKRVLNMHELPTAFWQPIASLDTNITSKHASAAYAKSIIKRAQHDKIKCEPVRTSAMVETGDWLCALLGGSVLYVLRPVPEPRLPASTSTKAHINGTKSSPLAKPKLRCKFIGECAVTTFMNDVLLEHTSDDEKRFDFVDFELV